MSRERQNLAGRRLLVFGLNAASWLALGYAMARVIGSAGWSWPQGVILLLFLTGLPWSLMGFWNSVIGFLILVGSRDPVRHADPSLARSAEDEPITMRTAICVAVRHEDVARLFTRLELMIASIAATPWAAHFSVQILSDSSRPDLCAAEEQAFARLSARYPQAGFLHYRRRAQNDGFKAGNLHEFAERDADAHDFMLVLDADSLMSEAAMMRLVRIMQGNQRLGILQTLVVGRPATSPFARIFQFGMRHGMRVHTMGISWWQGSSGPYWGHNAILRLAPFVAHCRLPILPGRPPLGGVVLSHDQLEAVLMRAADYEVRVIPDEFESWEENPPTLPDFITRDLRWCQGNMQYLKLLTRPGLQPLGRFQLLNAIMMYLGAPAWMLMLAAGLCAALIGTQPGGPAGAFPSDLAFALYVGMMAMGFAPRLLGVAEILLKRGQCRRYGGAPRLLAGTLVDALLSLLVGPLVMVAQARFVIGLAFGKRIVWDAQNRDGHAVSLPTALRAMAAPMIFGAVFGGALCFAAPGGLIWAAPTLIACALAVPTTCVTASPRLGAWMRRRGLCAVPDELAPVPELARLDGVTAPAALIGVPAE